MKKLFYFLLLVTSVLTVSSCFEITEEVTVNKDGSGNYISTINATKLSEQMQMLAAFDTTGEMVPKLKYSLDSTFSETFKKYAKIKGVANIKVDTSKPYIYKVSLDYKDVNVLNEVVNLDKKDAERQNLYAWKKGQLSRKDYALNLDDMQMEDESQKEMAKSMLEGMKYTVIFNLPGKVKNSINKEAVISSDKKKVTLECSLLDVMDKKVSLGNEVNYK